MDKSNMHTAYRQELRSKILKIATKEFRSKGIRAVKMDDIAGILSISKRTMYEIYENKEQLLLESVKENQKNFDRQMQAYTDNGKRNVIDIILEFYRLEMSDLSSVNPSYLPELHRYPKIMSWIKQKRERHEHNALQFFQKGVEEGYFRPDANYEILLKISDGTKNYIVENQLYKHYAPKEIFRNVIMLYLRGLCTLKGIREFDSQIARLDMQNN